MFLYNEDYDENFFVKPAWYNDPKILRTGRRARFVPEHSEIVECNGGNA